MLSWVYKFRNKVYNLTSIISDSIKAFLILNLMFVIHDILGKPAPTITWHINGERVTQNVSMISAPYNRRINATGILTLTANMGHNGKLIECQAYQQFMRSPFRTVATLDVQCKGLAALIDFYSLFC